MISVRSPFSETIREMSVIVVSTPSAPTKARPSASVVVIAAADVVVDGMVELVVVSYGATEVVVPAVSPAHAVKVMAVARTSTVRVLGLIVGSPQVVSDGYWAETALCVSCIDDARSSAITR